jgi:hypothetical protein
VSLTVIYCAKTLLLAASRGNPLLQHCYSQLLPGLVKYLAGVAEVSDGISSGDPRLSGSDEVIKALISFVQALDEDKSKFGLSMHTILTL